MDDSLEKPNFTFARETHSLEKNPDDSLEKPNFTPPKPDPQADDDEQGDDDEEDSALDWTKLARPGAAHTVIPKRGEKEFEPKAGGGSGLQQHILETSRNAMFDALRGVRATSTKSLSYGIWYPDISRVHITVARGTHMSSMGHSVSRPAVSPKRLELLPEEAIYLVERGSLFCWKPTDLPTSGDPDLENVGGVPMSVQQTYSEMLGKEDVTAERLEVYSYLRRLGYVVTRTKSPTESYPRAAPFIMKLHPTSLLSSFTGRISRAYNTFMNLGFNWWHPLQLSRWLKSHKAYKLLFPKLRFIPSGHNLPLHQGDIQSRETSPYNFFYNVYKPNTSFKRTSPPAPDYQMVVVNARTTPMPTLQELTALFEVTPEMPAPLPRRRNPPPGGFPPDPPPLEKTFLQRLLPIFFKPPPPAYPPRKPHPFMALKAGKKMVVIAVVDAGSIGFYRMGEGALEEWPMY